MDCEQAIALISARLDHEIQPDDRVLLDLHLRECPACRATAQAFDLQHQEMRGAFEPRRRAAAAVADRVKAQLPAMQTWGPKQSIPHRRIVRAALVLGAVAAAACILLMGWWLKPSARPVATNILKPLPPGLVFPEELTPRPRPEAPPATKLAVGESVETRAGEKRRLALPDGSVLYVNQNTMVRLDADRQATLTSGTVYIEVAPRDPTADGSTFSVHTPDGPVKAFGTKFQVRADDVQGSAVLVAQGRVTFDDIGVAAGQKLVLPTAAELAKTNTIKLSTPVAATRASHELDWTRDLMAAAESPLTPGSQYDGGALVAVDPYGQEAKLSLRNYRIDVHVEDGFARTTIDQTYFNNNPWQLEGTFYFPLPPDASLSRLAMYVNGELMEGGMTDREWGNAVYEKVVRSKRDPALLEWVDGSTFKMRVFPLEGRQEKRIVLSYTQRLSTLYGRTQYRFPAGHSLQVVDHWSFHGVVKNGGAYSWNSPSHPAMRSGRDGGDLILDAADHACKVDRDVEVDLIDPQQDDPLAERIRFSSAEQDGAGYLMLRFRPELPAAAQRQRRDWVFLFESSADRDPLLARAQIDIIRHMLQHIEHDDSFAVLTAGTTTRSFSDAPVLATPENTAAAVAFLERTHLIGALDLGRALTDAAPFLQAGQNPHLVHVGSGLTAMGRRQDKLAELLPAGVRYIGVGVGKHWGRSWMKETAESTGGYFTQINPDEPIAWRAFDLLSTLNTPRLLHVQVAPGDDGELPRFLTDNALVAQGEELCAVAQVARSTDGSLKAPRAVVVTGVLDGKPYRRELAVMDVAPHADYLPRTWAKLEIDRLLAANAGENRPRIVELSKAVYVMTPFTSLLVLENEAMYKEFKVDRGRKDHWAMYPCPQTIPVVFEPDPTQPIDVRNAPKTPKPVANLVRPTVVARAKPSFLGGAPLPVDEFGTPKLSKIPYLGRQFKNMGNEMFLGDRSGLGMMRPPEFFFEHANAGEGERLSEMFVMGRKPDLALRDKMHWRESNETTVAFTSDGTMLAAGREEAGIRLWDATPGEVDEDGIMPEDFGMTLGSDWGSMAGEGRERVYTYTNARAKKNVMLRQAPDFVEATAALKIKRAGSESSPRMHGLFRTTDIDAYVTVTKRDGLSRRRIQVSRAPALLYQSPSCTGDARVFSDLVSYAPGLNTTDADLQAVLDAEAAPNLADAPGHIDPDARRLIDQSRRPRWRTLTLGGVPKQEFGNEGKDGLAFHFDGAGRYTYEHSLPLGLRERVVCDGATLWHLYPDLGLAARRTVSRFHRAEVAGLTPWALPPAEDLARGADVEFVDEHTVALVPLGARTRRTDDDKPAPYYRLELIFAADGWLAERRLLEAPASKVVLHEVYDDKGGVRILDGDGKELASHRSKVADAAAPDLAVETANLVVLQMPLRSRARVFDDVSLDASRPLADDLNGCYIYLDGEQAVELLAGAMTEGNAVEAVQVFRDCFESRGDLRRGLFTLLAAAGAKVCTEPGFQRYAADHKDDPLARYFALLGNGAYDLLHRGTGLDYGARVGLADGFLVRLAAFRDLETRWQTGLSPWTDAALRRADEKRTFDFIRNNRDNVLGWALQIHVQNHARSNDARLHLALAQAWGVLAGDEEGAYTARYEQARCLFQAGKRDEARKLFLEIHGQALKSGLLPRIDGDFRDALRGKDADDWSAVQWKTATELIDKKDRPAAVMLAWQARQAGDRPLSDNLLAFVLDHPPQDGDGMETTLAAVEYLWQTDQLAMAADLLDRLLAEEANTNDAALWRQAATLAERRQMPDRAAACWEKALDLEYADLPSVIDLQSWRADYGKLLGYYQTQTTTLAGLHLTPPADLATRTIRTADRWRAHDPEADGACRTAAAILKTLGERDKAWEYLTTPAAARPDAIQWPGTAEQLSREGDLDLAERSYSVACEHDPEDAMLLWQRAQNLRQAGRAGEAQALLIQVAAGKWAERDQWIRAQALWQLERK